MAFEEPDPPLPPAWISEDEAAGVPFHVRPPMLRELLDAIAPVGVGEEAGVARASVAWGDVSGLRALIEGFCAHPSVDVKRTNLVVRRCVIRDEMFSDLDITCTLILADSNFSGAAWFTRASFGGDARFSDASFGGDAWFSIASFGGDARFGGASFGRDAEFDGASFGGDAWFGGASFGGAARFDGASFGGDAWFFGASFGGASFAGDARFDGASFGGDARFDGVTFDRDAKFDDADFQRVINFSSSVLRQRVYLDAARLGPESRFTYDDILALGGATFRLPLPGMRKVTPVASSKAVVVWAAEYFDIVLLWPVNWLLRVAQIGGRPEMGTTAAMAFVRWFGESLPRAFVLHEDSDDPEELRLAARNYELLAANLRTQPESDVEEDICRFQAHVIRAKREAILTRRRITGSASTVGRAAVAAIQRPGERVKSIRDCLTAFVVLVISLVRFVVRDVLWDWFVQRLCIGYMVEMYRLPITAALVIVAFAVIYQVGWEALRDDWIYFAGPPEKRDGHEWGDDWRNPLYFSIMSFVTLGYGDFAPVGAAKLITGVEALLGVTMLALFTVAWGRKMVR